MQFEENTAIHLGSLDSRPYIKPAKGSLVLPSLVTEFDKVCTQF